VAHWRNRRASTHRSHLARIPLEKLFSEGDDILVYNAKSSSYTDPSGDPFEHALTDPLVVSRPQYHPGPANPQWKIPPTEWPTVLWRIDQGETLRTIARDYAVSYEAVRRVIRAARQLQIG
jgi:hypothetical protein